MLEIKKSYYVIFVIIAAIILGFFSIKYEAPKEKPVDLMKADETKEDKSTTDEIEKPKDETTAQPAPEEGDTTITEKEKEEAKETLGDDIQVSDITKGTQIDLVNESLYISSKANVPSNYKTGAYYTWGYEANGRIAITNKLENIGVKGQVTGWIDKPATAQ